MHLHILPETFAILKLKPEESVPEWVQEEDALSSITHTDDEISIICQESSVPADFSGDMEKGWCAVKVKGKLDFSMAGIISALTVPLADAQVSMFSISTFNTEYIFIKEEDLPDAITAWQSQDYQMTD